MKIFCLLCTFLLCVVTVFGQQGGYGSGKSITQPKAGAAVDEVVVESSLYIKKKPQIRRSRDVLSLIPIEVLSRVKRAHRHRVGSSQSAANAAANSNFFGPQGFGASAANAQAQGFQTQGPLGGFGASATNTQTQAFTANGHGIQGSASAAGTQTYNLPDGHKINVVFGNGFSTAGGGNAASMANGVTIS